MYAKPVSDKRLVFRIYEEFSKLGKKSKQPNKKWAKRLSDRLTQEGLPVASKPMEQLSLVTRELQIKTTTREHRTPVGMAGTAARAGDEPPELAGVGSSGALPCCRGQGKVVQGPG